MSLLRPKAIFQYLILIVSINQTPLFAQTIADLDRIQDKASSYKEFSANAKLRKEYVAAAQSYFGSEEAFPQVSFDAILAQLDQMAESDAILAERIWRKEVLGPTFSIKIGNGQGKQVDSKKWNAFVNEVRARVQKKSGTWFEWWTSKESSEQFVKAVAAAEEDIKATFAKQAYSKELFATLMAKYEAVSMALLAYQLEEEDNREGLQSQSWEAITAVTHKFSAEQKTLKWGRLLPTTPQLVKYWKFFENEFMHSEFNFLNYGELNNVAAAEREVTFRSIRTFHALFRGLPVKECTAGDCTVLERLSPRRYAIPLLDGVWVQIMEEASKGSGHLQGVFMKNPSVGTVMNVDLMAGKLREIVTIADASRSQKVSIFELWLREVQKHLGGSIGVAIGEALNANNEKMQEFVRTKKYYHLGLDVGPAKSFGVIDGDMAYRISLLSWNIEKEHHYGNCLTFDGCDLNSGNLRVLNPGVFDSKELTDDELMKLWSTSKVSKSQILIYSSRSLQAALVKADPEGFKSTMLSLSVPEKLVHTYTDFLQTKILPNEQEILELKKTKHRFIMRALSFLAKPNSAAALLPDNLLWMKKEDIIDLETETEVDQFKLIKNHVYNLKKRGELSSPKEISIYVKNYSDFLPKSLRNQFVIALIPEIDFSIFNIQQIQELRQRIFTIEEDLAILRKSYKYFNEVSALLLLATPANSAPNDSYKKALSNFIVEATPYFMSLKPTAADIKAWLLKCHYTAELMETRKKMLQTPLTSKQVIAVFSNEYGHQSAAKAYNDLINTFYLENWQKAFAALDNIDDFIQGVNISNAISQCIDIRTMALKFVKTPQDFFRLYKMEREHPTDAYKEALLAAIAGQADFFLSLNPSIPEAEAYMNNLTNAYNPTIEKVRAYIETTKKSHPVRSFLEKKFHRDLVKCASLLVPGKPK